MRNPIIRVCSMRALVTFGATLIVAVSLAAGQVPPTLPQQARPGAPAPAAPTPAKKGTGVIRGHVTAADTGRPLRFASITIRAQGIYDRTQSDADGAYEIKGLAAGKYTAQATKAGYIQVEFGQKPNGEGAQPVDVADGQSVDNVDFVVPRGGVIAGRILDEDGEPIEGARVTPMILQFVAGQYRVMRLSPTRQTRDNGSYRLFGLSPGEYLVGVTPPPTPGSDQPAAAGSGAVTYFPSTLNVDVAQKVKVSAGHEMSGIDFGLINASSYQVSGTVTDSSGGSVTGATVLISPGGKGGTTAPVTGLVQDGRFSVANVVEGPATVQVMWAGSPQNLEFASTEVTVSSDINGLALKTRPGLAVKGRIQFEGGQPDFPIDQVRVSPLPTDFARTPMIGTGLHSATNADGTFQMDQIWGPRLLLVSAPAGWGLKSVIADGVDYTDKPIDFDEGPVRSLIVTVTNRITELSGRASDERSAPVACSVVVFATDPARWFFQSRFVQVAKTDAQGAYSIPALPPGDYLAACVTSMADRAENDPAFLQTLRSRASRFTLAEGERKVLALKGGR